METILGDALVARLVGCKTAGNINIMEVYYFKLKFSVFVHHSCSLRFCGFDQFAEIAC